MIICSTEVHPDAGKARLGVDLAADALGIRVNTKTPSMWHIDCKLADLETFLELAREEARR